MFVTFQEIIDMIVMIAAVGFIFMAAFRAVKHKYGDELSKYLGPNRFKWHDFWFAAMVTAPAILLHELGHKIVALTFGLNATFHAAYFWLGLAIALRLVNFPFIFFVPAYVSITGAVAPLASTWVAFAGPGVNLVLFITSWIVVKRNKKMHSSQHHFWNLTKNINLFLFIFNMIPIPMFDGFTVFSGLWKIIGF